MTETPGASAIPSDLPLPRDAAGAATLREQLTSDAEWMKDWRTDQGKYSTLGYLRWVEGGADPDAWGRAPATPDEVRSQMTDRELAFDDERIETYAKHIANFDDVTRATIARACN
jgi:hypothetical protein